MDRKQCFRKKHFNALIVSPEKMLCEGQCQDDGQADRKKRQLAGEIFFGS